MLSFRRILNLFDAILVGYLIMTFQLLGVRLRYYLKSVLFQSTLSGLVLEIFCKLYFA